MFVKGCGFGRINAFVLIPFPALYNPFPALCNPFLLNKFPNKGARKVPKRILSAPPDYLYHF